MASALFFFCRDDGGDGKEKCKSGMGRKLTTQRLLKLEHIKRLIAQNIGTAFVGFNHSCNKLPPKY